MKRIVDLFLPFLLFFAIIPSVWAGDMSITVYQSDGTTPFPGVTIKYYDGYWKPFGTTNASGVADLTILDGTYNFRAEYEGTSVQQSLTVNGSSSGTFYSTETTIKLRKSDGTNLSGITVDYYSGYWRSFGIGSGKIVREMFPGTLNFRASKEGTSVTQSLVIQGDGTTSGTKSSYYFFTTKLEFYAKKSDGSSFSSVAADYYSGYWRNFPSQTNSSGMTSAELFPGTFNFRASFNGTSSTQMATIAGDGTSSGVISSVIFYSTAVNIYAKESDGTPLPKVSMAYYSGYWRNLGKTNSLGHNCQEAFPGTFDFRASYKGTSVTQNIALAGDGTYPGAIQNIDFYTTKVKVYAKKSDSSPFIDVEVSYYSGYWRFFGKTNGAGNKTKELFPGTHNFRVQNDGTSATQSVIISGDGTTSGAMTTVYFYSTLVNILTKKSDNSPFEGVETAFYSGYWRILGTTDATGTKTAELFPGTFNFRASQAGTSATQNIALAGDGTSAGASSNITFYTTEVTFELKGCDTSPIPDVSCDYYSGYWRNLGVTDAAGLQSTEIFPGTFNFRASTGGTSKTKNETVPGDGATVGQTLTIPFTPTKIDYSFGGVIKYYSGYWRTITGETYLFEGTYNFKFGDYATSLNVTGCELTGDVFIFQTKIHDGSPLPNMEVKRNDYGNHFVSAGTTDANGVLFSTTIPAGSWKFRVTKNYSYQDITSGPDVLTFQTSKYLAHVTNSSGSDFENIEVEYNDYGNHWIDLDPQFTDANGNSSIQLFPGNYNFRAKKNYSIQEKMHEILTSGTTGTIEFQTAKYVAHVTNSSGVDFAGIEVEYNDYGNHWIDLDPQFTDVSGNSQIELFPGNYNFRAKKNYSIQEKSHEILTSGTTGTVEFQTSEYIAHVTKHDGSDFEGIEVEYNDYGNHWIDLSPQFTDINGNSSIELFPGNFDFRAKKNYSIQEKSLEILTSGISDIVEFQTSLAIGLVKDCENNNPVAGIEIEYNDYGNHWIDLSPQFTLADGKASIELFPGTYDLRAKNIYTIKEEQIILDPVSISPTTTVEFNPTRVCFNFGGTVKYNDYGNHWINLPCDSYMFPGTYDFRFDTEEKSIAISGCAITQTIVYIEFLDSNGSGISGEEGLYRVGGTYFSGGLTDTDGKIMVFMEENLTSTYFRMKYLGHTQTKYQNIISDPTVTFQTTPVTVEMINSGGTDLNAEELLYRDGEGTYVSLGTNTSEETIEMLPLSYYFRAKYLGHTETKYQNTNTNNLVTFQTTPVTVEMINSGGADLNAEELLYRDGEGNYISLGSTTSEETIEMLPLSYYFRAKYLGHTETKYQNTNTNNLVTFQTTPVTVEMINSGGADLNAEELLYRDGEGNYISLGSTTSEETIEMLPLSYYFRAKYLGHSETKYQNTNTNNLVTFQTTPVTVEMINSSGLDQNAEELYYRNGAGNYVSIGLNTSEETIEMLPLSYYFRAKYLGHSETKYQNTNSNNLVTFQTTSVTVSLEDNGGNPLNADEIFYRNGEGTYVSVGTIVNSVSLEMLPLSYYFRTNYSSDSHTKYQNVNINPSVEFVWNGSSLSKVDFASTVQMPEMNVYPNPAQSKTMIDLTIHRDNNVYLAFFDMSGRVMQVIYTGFLEEGSHKFKLDVSQLAEGSYICRFISGNEVQNKFIIVKH